jgi:hypothetical protein
MSDEKKKTKLDVSKNQIRELNIEEIKSVAGGASNAATKAPPSTKGSAR